MRSWPLYLRWHRRKNRIHIAAGFQPKDCAAVIQQVELDVASTSDQLLLAVGLVPGKRKIAPDKLGIDFQERAADVLGEGQVGVPIAGIVPVVEDAADAAGFLAVRQVKI